MYKKGQTNMAFTIAAMAISLYVVTIVIGVLDTQATASLSSSTLATQGIQNVSQYTWIALTLGAIGILVYAGMTILGFFGGVRR